jgi:hypothetical protein
MNTSVALQALQLPQLRVVYMLLIAPYRFMPAQLVTGVIDAPKVTKLVACKDRLFDTFVCLYVCLHTHHMGRTWPNLVLAQTAYVFRLSGSRAPGGLGMQHCKLSDICFSHCTPAGVMAAATLQGGHGQNVSCALF